MNLYDSICHDCGDIVGGNSTIFDTSHEGSVVNCKILKLLHKLEQSKEEK